MVESLIVATLGAELVETFNDPNYRPPPLPSVALELMSLTNRDDSKIERIVRLLEQDEMLAGGLMRLIGSPLYAGRSPIRTLKEAVVRLGVRTVRDLVFETALSQGVFTLAEYSETIEQIRRHSTVTAYIARIVCKHAKIDEENAFLCGLLHDIGFAGLLFAVSNIEAEDSPPLIQLWPDIDALHEQASRLVTQLWQLPLDMQEVVGHHHHLHTGKTSRIAAAINIADQLSERFGASVVGPVDADGNLIRGDIVDEFDLEVSRAELHLSSVTMDRIIEDAEATVPDILWL
ncbi:MAG TPA: HDOD domain-containing protein [Polyangiaceae bacterium]|jgi:HD-like signal output (HDOD) protein|nr:HDOD domain-containing protein [Polyangiaceae bacterium]